jgi:single-strand DNA-binding protein
MGSVNKVIILGRLGADPELSYTNSNRALCKLSVATSETWVDRQTQNKKEKTEWHKIVIWGPQAEAASKYLAKGREVYIEGKLQTEKWQDKEGRDRFTTSIVADKVVFVGGGGGGEARDSGGGGRGQHREEHAGNGRRGVWGDPAPDNGARDDAPSPGDDDIPF